MRNKVLIIVENSAVPLDPRVWKEATTLQKSGYQVSVLCPRISGARLGYEVIEGVHIYRHPMVGEGAGVWGYVREYIVAFFWECLYAWWIYFTRGFHVIQGCNPPDDIFLVTLPFKLFGVKYIFDHHDINPELFLAKYKRKNLLYKTLLLFEKLTYLASDVVLATNESYKEIAVTRGGVSPERVFVVRNGPDLATFRPVQENDALKHGKPFLVGYVGTMNIQDGLDILLDVVRHVKNMGRRDIHFTCVGGGPSLSGLLKSVQENRLDDIINFTGRIPDSDLLEILSTADVCVNPDVPCEMNDKSTMIKIMEYMALGKPIVQFDLREGKFTAQEASLYADKTNQVPDFAAKIVSLLGDPDMRRWMGKAGRKRIEEELSWEHSVPNLLAAYRKVLPQSGIETVVVDREQSGNATHNGTARLQRTPEPRAFQSRGAEVLIDHYRCPEDFATFSLSGEMRASQGFFRFGTGALCYGQTSGETHTSVDSPLYDALSDVIFDGARIGLPFDPAQVIENLTAERYVRQALDPRNTEARRLLHNSYYLFRPFMSPFMRRQVQRFYFRGWQDIPFPAWPVDSTVQNLHEQLLLLALQSRKGKPIPFVWFWPDGAPSCTIVTHDVETQAGLGFASRLMDLNDSFAIKASFQLVPERRYKVPESLLTEIRDRGFEVNVHDLNHDGRLFLSKAEFVRRAERINHHIRRLGAEGFRSAVMYRNVDWHNVLDVSYDMSIPNVSHLDPQRGGCCTVLPFIIGTIVELPLTLTQDYTLFHILNDRSTKVWRGQIRQIRKNNGLVSVNVHPDYISSKWAQSVYKDLLAYFAELRSARETWIALPREVARWWRQRSRLSLVPSGDSWRIEGEGKERARLAHAVLDNGSLRYEVSTSAWNTSNDVSWASTLPRATARQSVSS